MKRKYWVCYILVWFDAASFGLHTDKRTRSSEIRQCTVSCYSISQSKWFCLTLKILKMSPLSPSESICKTCLIQVGVNTTRKTVTFDFEFIAIDCLQVGMGPGHRGSCCSRSCLYTVWTRLGGCYCWNDKSILNAQPNQPPPKQGFSGGRWEDEKGEKG